MALILGIVIGAVLGVTGAGGGILAVPALVFGLGWSMPQAAPVGLVAIALAALVGALEGLRRRLVRYKAALLMAVIGMFLTPLGLRAAKVVPERALLLLFAAVMLLVAWRMYRHAAKSHADQPSAGDEAPLRMNPSTGKLRWSFASAGTLAAIGATSGFLTGLLGVGGGFLIVPALRHYSDIAMQGVVATSLAVIALVAAQAVAIAYMNGQSLPLAVAAPFAGGAAAGMLAGRLAARRLKGTHMQKAFSIVTALVALLLVARAFGAFG